ncbi:MAG: SpoVG family protein [Candidatus Eisenbacteria bacterium]
MDITDVQINLHAGGKLRAFASVTLSDAIVVRGIKVIEGARRTFIAMPTRHDGKKQTDVCHPTNQAARDELEKAVLEEFERTLRRGNGRPRDAGSDGLPNNPPT